MPDLGFEHRYRAGTSRHTILALHGTGGNEDDLLPLVSEVAPGSHVLSPRGQVLEDGMPRFFRRIAMGVFDEPDLRRRAADLSDFVRKAAEAYGFSAADVWALGYSNGANIAAALLLLHPTTLAGAALLRPVLPLTPDVAPDLTGRPVLIAAGDRDPYAPAERVQALADALEQAGAEVDVKWQQAGHELAPPELGVVREWLAAHLR